MVNRLKEAREAAGMTQENLAEASGVSRTTIWAIETNEMKDNISTVTLLKLAKALNCQMPDIFSF